MSQKAVILYYRAEAQGLVAAGGVLATNYTNVTAWTGQFGQAISFADAVVK